MNWERLFKVSFMVSLVIFWIGPYIWDDESLSLHLMTDLIMMTAAGAMFVVLFLKRWWKGVPTKVVWPQLSAACTIAGMTIYNVGEISVLYGILDDFLVFKVIGWLFAIPAIWCVIVSIRARMYRRG